MIGLTQTFAGQIAPRRKTMTKHKAIIAGLLLTLTASTVYAQTASTEPSAKPKTSKARHKSEEQQMLEQMDARIQKLEDMMTKMQQRMEADDKQIAATRKQALTAQAETEMAASQQKVRAESALEAVTKERASVNELQAAITDLKAENAGLVATVMANQNDAMSRETPTAIHYFGVDFKPGGFLSGETVSRQHAIGGDVNTQFSALPFSGQTAADFSEFNGSGRQSRFSLLTEGKLSKATLRGYYEADFLSAGTTSNDNESNSYTLRQRQVWAQAELAGGLVFTAGQMWSLATEYKSGLTNLKEAIPLTIDAQYNVGFTWARQYGFRIAQRVGTKFWVGASVEEAQTLNIGGHNLLAIVYQQPGNSSGLYNSSANYSYNFAPDLIGKVTYDPGFGHFEAFAIGRFFRARVFPNAVSLNGSAASTAPTAGAYTSKAQGGGFGLNARVPLFAKRVDFGAHILAGNGIGRYSTTTLPDATEHADGSVELLTGGSALASLEYHATPKFDLYAYYGGEYVKRAYYNTGLTVTSGVNVGQPILSGYGAPTNNVSGCNVEVAPVTSSNGGGYVPGSAANCQADNRNIQEGTFGYWYRFYKGPKGTLQQGIQYSYGERHTWIGVPNLLGGPGSPKAIDNMWFTSFRYYLPQ
jgi:hypothetical protein